MIQSEVAGRVAEALRTRVSPAQRLRLGRRPTRDLEAYNLYTLGRHQHSQGTPEALQREIDYYHRAIERDPMFARAYAALALLWMWQALGYFGIHPRDARVQAELYG